MSVKNLTQKVGLIRQVAPLVISLGSGGTKFIGFTAY